MSKKRFFWHLLLVASSIAAFVSLLTTALGLERYIPIFLAWLLSFAVQAGLFGMAWLIGASIQRFRSLVILLYCLTMPFSVTFSYVTLQSEFAKNIKPQESQRTLFDHTRRNVSELGAEVSEGINAADDVILRLESWLEMENTIGWATETCEEEDHCYLLGVCSRIKERIASWERTYAQPYEHGPGKHLIYGLLDTEVKAASRLSNRLEAFQGHWAESGVLEPGIDNRERLMRYDTALARIPYEDVKSILCRSFTVPAAPAYEDYARDDALAEEQPVYAFEDLLTLFDSNHRMNRADYPTVFALLLALFVDFFVLFIAIGATLVGARGAESRDYPVVQPVPAAWDHEVERDVEMWIDGSLLSRSGDAEVRVRFIEGIVKSIYLDGAGRSVLIPKDHDHLRFGHLLVKSKAAMQERTKLVEGEGSQAGFVLEDWVYPALSRYFRFYNEPSKSEENGDEVDL